MELGNDSRKAKCHNKKWPKILKLISEKTNISLTFPNFLNTLPRLLQNHVIVVLWRTNWCLTPPCTQLPCTPPWWTGEETNPMKKCVACPSQSYTLPLPLLQRRSYDAATTTLLQRCSYDACSASAILGSEQVLPWTTCCKLSSQPLLCTPMPCTSLQCTPSPCTQRRTCTPRWRSKRRRKKKKETASLTAVLAAVNSS